jgi:exodeoxyribonuclease-1
MLRVLDAWDLPKLLQVVYTRDLVEYDAEQALYDSFLGSDDRRVLDHLRTTDSAELASIKPAFDDPRLDELFLRYKARHYPETLFQRELDKWEEHRYRKLITEYAGSRTVAMVRESVAHWRKKLSESDELQDPAKLGILDDVQAYTDRIAAVIDPYVVAVPAPPETTIMDSARPAQPNTIPVQPDLSGDEAVASPSHAVRPRRR